MKQVQAVVRPEKLEPVKEALVALGINGMTVHQVRGFGQQLGHLEVYRGVKREARLLPKVMITTVVADEQLEGVLAAIQTTASTGDIGDGKIVVTTLQESVRIRTGETGAATLS
ncbi:P-II family nitrogen regulator [Synechococcus sp. FGCU-3]|nr:P-II family nitrogen regulator [Synechococcus sp. FGCU3]